MSPPEKDPRLCQHNFGLMTTDRGVKGSNLVGASYADFRCPVCGTVARVQIQDALDSGAARVHEDDTHKEDS